MRSFSRAEDIDDDKKSDFAKRKGWEETFDYRMDNSNIFEKRKIHPNHWVTKWVDKDLSTDLMEKTHTGNHFPMKIFSSPNYSYYRTSVM